MRIKNRLPLTIISSALICLTLLATGCSKKATSINPSTRKVSIDVYDDRVQPQQLVLGTGIAVDAHITNRGSRSCAFTIASYAPQPLVIEAGQSGDLRFTIDTPAGNPTSNRVVQAMGCNGQTQQQGTVVVEFKGVKGGQ